MAMSESIAKEVYCLQPELVELFKSLKQRNPSPSPFHLIVLVIHRSLVRFPSTMCLLRGENTTYRLDNLEERITTMKDGNRSVHLYYKTLSGSLYKMSIVETQQNDQAAIELQKKTWKRYKTANISLANFIENSGGQTAEEVYNAKNVKKLEMFVLYEMAKLPLFYGISEDESDE